MTVADEQQHERIDAALARWRQGDCVLGRDHWFVVRTTGKRLDATSDITSDLGEEEVPGLAVITQSCDVVRSYKDRPYVAVAPLVQVDVENRELISKGYRPQFAVIPGVVDKGLVADLDRVMTIDKAVIANWTQTKGCNSDEQVRNFSRAVSRKLGRFAFPEDFNVFAKKLQNRIREKHGKPYSTEGIQLRQLQEIRVRAAPSWDAADVELMFWFLAKPEDVAGVCASGVLPAWLNLVKPAGRFKKVQGQIATHADITAVDYLESDQLDLDYLSDA